MKVLVGLVFLALVGVSLSLNDQSDSWKIYQGNTKGRIFDQTVKECNT